MSEKRHKINKFANYQNIIVRNSPAFDCHAFVFFSRLLIYSFWRNAHDQYTNPLASPLLITLQVVRTLFGFHLRECMGSSFPSPAEKLPGLLRNRPLFLKFSFPSSLCYQGEFYPCQLFPSQMHEIFILSWPEFLKASQQLLKISDDFLKTSERCWNHLKMFRPPLSSSEAISKGKILVCCDTVGHKYFQGNWTARLLLIMC